MSSTEYTVDLRDIRFVLHEQLQFTRTMSAFPRYAEFDQATYDQFLEEAARFALEVLAPTNPVGDREGVRLDEDGVHVPSAYAEAWRLEAENGWFGLTAPPEFGGMGAPHTLDAAVHDMFTGASPAFATYPELARSAANLLLEFAREQWWARIAIEKLFAGEWGGTMCLTEAGAGSDVGASRTKALPTDEPGVYRIVGEKIFITAGDHDLADNIVHLVLARTPDAPPGTSGLSLFLVPKFVYDEQGAIGDRNGVYAESIEEKMGLHGSATCAMSFGVRHACRGWLVGSENEGMRIMFHMMNAARIGVGIQGVASAAAAYRFAVHYANERVQGQPVDRFGDDDAPRVPIVEHPDVRRMLMWQKVHVEGMRALIYETALLMDEATVTEDEARRRELMGLVELMTPIVKAYCTDRGFESAVLAMQVFGGYGYTREYPVEQHVRDLKIGSIYEGTNGIQAMDLLGRKMRRGGGVLFMAWLNRVNAELDRCREAGGLDAEVAALEKARDALGGAAMHLGKLAMGGKLAEAMLHAVPFLRLFGLVALGYELLWQARVAGEALAGEVSESDRAFYRGKRLNAAFYCANVLPEALAIYKGITSGDASCLDGDLFRV